MLDQAFSLVLKCRVNGITRRDHGEADFLSPPTSPSSALSGSILLFSKLDPLKTALMLPLLSFLLPVIAIATLVQRGIGPRREK
ncbi:unnamed protein product [Brassica rapa]|uniref:Uncharacterized protein n=1 Tax=Brassica campestris TaxID=3711 RepID=A0A8D9CYC6_BRACM|nr:unnamed protein product [Brassica rapa]